MKKLIVFLPFVAIVALIASCGGGSSSGGTEEETGGGTTTTVTTVTQLSEVPDAVLNPQAYDLTTQSASISAPVKSVGKAQQVGGFSRAGCETDTLKKNIIRNAIMPRMILCNVRAMETAAGGAAAGSGAFNYWKMTPPSGEQGPSGVDSFAPRMAIKSDGNVFTFVMCNGTTKSMELVIDSSGGLYSGHVINKWGTAHDGSLTFSADGLPASASAAASFTSASFSQSFVEAGDYFSGYGSATLVATPTSNVVYGFNSGTAPGNGGTFAGATYAKFDATQGTATYRMDSGSFPGQTVEQAFSQCVGSGHCVGESSAADWVDPTTGWLVNGNPCSLTGLTVQSFLCFGGGSDCPTAADVNGLCSIASGSEHAESFTINNTNPLSLVFAVAETSIYATDVAAATVPSSATQPTIAFTSASADVDCSASDSWTEPTFTSMPDMATCRAMEQEMNNWQSGDVCANQESQNGAGNAR